MEARQRPSRPRTDFSYVSTASLLATLSRTVRPNVRLMEELVARGPGWEPGVVAVLNLAVSGSGRGEDPPPNPVWLAVVAGVMRLETAVPGLLKMLRAAPEGDHDALVAAAEALARIGGPAVDGVARVAREGEWWQLADVVVSALVDRGARDRLIDRDWRLRYLMDPEHGFIDTGWPGSAVVFTEDNGTRPRLAVPAPAGRTPGQILSRRVPLFGVRVDPDGNPLCRCCDARMWVPTGVWVCPATAMTVLWIQDRWLTLARDEHCLDDLFDVFEILEDEYHALIDGIPLDSPWDQDEGDRLTAVRWAWRGIEWLIERGVEDVRTAGERIREEATKLVGLEALAKHARGSGAQPSVN